MTTVRAAMTQTINAYADMPTALDGLPALAGRLDEIRSTNVEHHLELIAQAAELGVQVICLGELFAAPYFALRRDAFWFGLAEDAFTGPTVTAMSAAAARLGIVIVAPIYELDAHTGSRYNTAVVIDADGEIVGRYRKTHIPAGSNEQATFDERFYYDPSQTPQNKLSPKVLGDNPYFPVFQTAAGRIGVAICYDRHFEGVVRTLSQAGAQTVFSPAVTFGEKSRRMWDLEFAVDAARHRVYIGGSNRLGAERPWNQAYSGQTHFVGPGGRVEDRSDTDRLVIADLDLDSLEDLDDSGWNLPRDARPDIYS